jgi:hypothetical protein
LITPAPIEHILVEHNRGAAGPSIANYWGSDYRRLDCPAQAIAAYAPISISIMVMIEN